MTKETKTLEHASKTIKRAHDVAVMELARLHPVGSSVAFSIMSGQTTPSTGVVQGYSVTLGSWGSVSMVVHVEHDQAKQGGRYRIRAVPLGSVWTGM